MNSMESVQNQYGGKVFLLICNAIQQWQESKEGSESAGVIDWTAVSKRVTEQSQLSSSPTSLQSLTGDECHRIWKFMAYGEEYDKNEELCASDEEDYYLQPLDAISRFENGKKAVVKKEKEKDMKEKDMKEKDNKEKGEKKWGILLKSKRLIKLRKPKFFVPHQIITGTPTLQHVVFSNVYSGMTLFPGSQASGRDISVCRLASSSSVTS